MRSKSENLKTLRMKTNMMKIGSRTYMRGEVRLSATIREGASATFYSKLYLGRGFLREESRLDKTIKMLFHPKIKHCWLFR